MLQLFTVPAAGRQIDAQGVFFKYEAADPAAVDATIRVRVDGNDLGTFLPGDSFELPIVAKTWVVTPVNAVGDATTVRIGMGRMSSVRTVAQLSGNVGVNVLSAKAPIVAFANTAATVTSASAQLLAAKANRQYLYIENNDPSGTIALVFGAAATMALGKRIAPGGYFEWNGVVPSNAVFAIGSIASNSNIVTIEG